MANQPKRHPARYTMSLLPIFAEMLQGSTRILDPFAGTGRIFLLNQWLPDCRIEGVEIEKDWADLDPRLTWGDALALPWPDNHFDAICTSPTYGNRMADKFTDHQIEKGYIRNTYRHCLDRELHPHNSGGMQWGGQYRDFHLCAWKEARRVLRPGGRFVLNIKDHIRNKKRQYVTDWHVGVLAGLGFDEIRHEQIQTPGQRFGQNGQARIGHESVILFLNNKETLHADVPPTQPACQSPGDSRNGNGPARADGGPDHRRAQPADLAG